jgi:hypothetical protein
VRHVCCSAIVPGDEAWYRPFEVPSKAAVVEANRRLHAPCDRIVEAVALLPACTRQQVNQARTERSKTMMRLILVLVTAMLAVGGTAFGAFATPTGTSNDDPVWKAILKARDATEKYQDVRVALEDGYKQVSPCVEGPPGAGAMGIHYLNEAYVADPAIRAGKPELLLYFPEPGGKLRLVGVEYFRPDADQDLTTTNDRPYLAGIPFNGPMEGHDPGMPRHYDLHAWVWTWNPSGVFSQFNSSLHCPS